MRYVAAVLGGFDDSLTVDRLLLRLPHDIAKVRKSPEYLYAEVLRDLLKKFWTDLYRLSEAASCFCREKCKQWHIGDSCPTSRPLPSDPNFSMEFMILDSQRWEKPLERSRDLHSCSFILVRCSCIVLNFFFDTDIITEAYFSSRLLDRRQTLDAIICIFMRRFTLGHERLASAGLKSLQSKLPLTEKFKLEQYEPDDWQQMAEMSEGAKNALVTKIDSSGQHVAAIKRQIHDVAADSLTLASHIDHSVLIGMLCSCLEG